jgi:hypothetical protein
MIKSTAYLNEKAKMQIKQYYYHKVRMEVNIKIYNPVP